MTRRTFLIPFAVLACVALPASVRAQSADPYRTTVRVVPSSNWGYSYDPYGGYLHGAAEVIRAQNEFLLGRQQEALIREEVRAKKLERRRREIEHYAWETQFRIEAVEKERELIRREQVRRSRNDPPITEIWSAKALNDLLRELEKHTAALHTGRSVAVEPEWFDHIHVTSGKGGGNLGLLKDGRVLWPLLLLRPQFETERRMVDQLVQEIIEQARRQLTLEKTLPQLQQRVALLQQRLNEEKPQLRDEMLANPRLWTNAKSLLHQLDTALVMLEEPDAAFYLVPVQGKTVAEVVDYMKRKGVQFAPATAGGERHYTALHRALAEELDRVAPSANQP